MSLISADLLATQLDDPAVRIVDTRWYLVDLEQGRREYDESHIPGALFMDVEADLSSAQPGPGRHPLPPWDEFIERLGASGIGARHHVVAYDTTDGSIAARLWWMLRRLSHYRVSVLDGGWDAWQAAGLQTETAVRQYPATTYSAQILPGGMVDRAELRSNLGEVLLLDARAPERYQGIIEPVDPIAGHIPTALNAFHGGNVTGDGTFKAPHELRARFTELGAGEGTTVVTYCGSGVTSCHNILAMHLAGLPEPLLYPGSWSDWSTASYPVAIGEEPGEVPGQ